jgi:hypothetical protein
MLIVTAMAALPKGHGETKNPPGANREGVLRFSGYFFIPWSAGIRIE